MDIKIESTKKFENDLSKLSEAERETVIKQINDCAELFFTHKASVYRKLRRLRLNLPSLANGYESSLYRLKVSQKLRVILTVDEDPIFGQIIFTLFRVIQHQDLYKAYESVAESLYQDVLHHDPESIKVS
jgi:mRNA-degrading endonuclease RelE of RelBE toxin-antitoxin system